jgi:hypothetical protein
MLREVPGGTVIVLPKQEGEFKMKEIQILKDKLVDVRFFKDGRNIHLADGELLPKGTGVIHQWVYTLTLQGAQEIAEILKCKYYVDRRISNV